MIAPIAARFGPWVLAGVLGLLTLYQHDQLVTWRLKDKDQQAREYNLRRDIGERDRKILARAGDEADDRGEADQACATEISSSFQKGVAVGRAINHAKGAPPPAPGRQPGPGGMLDYRQAWEASAFKPGAAGSAASGDLRAPRG
ncbi:hypothetical protein [Caulobacter vibrioides]|uniref:hypothetical protein n=1 Tax=Caulobacter vibrioides TaxID=155892 RepID=UPI000BB46B61|nr:hypothetical protein [Caulobacter vibrioides]ATC25226.1 hypothetical protein CA608_12140 [Caulobacter vibrioides]PLR13996.1 hypothetical protein CVUC_05440 [Caulobacter vibrioides]